MTDKSSGTEYPPVLNGKTPWEFACSWYRASEIARSIEAAHKRFGSLMADITNDKIPGDVRSPEFSAWLTDQYRLAMTKGIEIGLQSSTAVNSHAELVAAIEVKDKALKAAKFLIALISSQSSSMPETVLVQLPDVRQQIIAALSNVKTV